MYPQFTNYELNNMTKWKYTVVDNSITSIFLNPFWNCCLKIIPLWLAPNVLTLINLLVTIGIWYVTEHITVSIPLIIFCYFMISTLDGLDGKQARRINNSTVFGELFDHSVDIVTLFSMARISTIIYGIRDLHLLPLYIIIGSVFCYTHYRAYIDRYMTLPKYSGPNEMLILIILTYLTNNWIPWGYIFGSAIVNHLAIMGYIAVTIYLSTISNGDNNKNYYINLSVTRYCFIFLIATYLSITHLQVICMFIMINAELITMKMTNSNLRYELTYICMICLVHKWIAFTIMCYVVFNIFNQIKNYYAIPFLTVSKKN